MFTHKLIKTTAEGRSVPLRLGLATYRPLAGSFGGFKGRSKRSGIRHVGKVLSTDEDVVENKSRRALCDDFWGTFDFGGAETPCA
jgi:hypothetical protein